MRLAALIYQTQAVSAKVAFIVFSILVIVTKTVWLPHGALTVPDLVSCIFVACFK